MLNLYCLDVNQIYIYRELIIIMEAQPLMGTQPLPFKGFWIRFLAVIVDAVILGIAVWGSAAVFGIFFGSLFGLGTGVITFFLILIIAFFGTLLYKPIMEASEYQGTFGKYFLNMKVVDKNGRKITMTKSFIRTIVFSVLLFIPFLNLITVLAFLMIVFTEENQGLHDFTAETYVVSKYWQGSVPLQDNFGA